jgi:hypothetical protein
MAKTVNQNNTEVKDTDVVSIPSREAEEIAEELAWMEWYA